MQLRAHVRVPVKVLGASAATSPGSPPRVCLVAWPAQAPSTRPRAADPGMPVERCGSNNSSSSICRNGKHALAAASAEASNVCRTAVSCTREASTTAHGGTARTRRRVCLYVRRSSVPAAPLSARRLYPQCVATAAAAANALPTAAAGAACCVRARRRQARRQHDPAHTEVHQA